jgi:hypothetical protein
LRAILTKTNAVALLKENPSSTEYEYKKEQIFTKKKLSPDFNSYLLTGLSQNHKKRAYNERAPHIKFSTKKNSNYSLVSVLYD